MSSAPLPRLPYVLLCGIERRLVRRAIRAGRHHSRRRELGLAAGPADRMARHRGGPDSVPGAFPGLSDHSALVPAQPRPSVESGEASRIVVTIAIRACDKRCVSFRSIEVVSGIGHSVDRQSSPTGSGIGSRERGARRRCRVVSGSRSRSDWGWRVPHSCSAWSAARRPGSMRYGLAFSTGQAATRDTRHLFPWGRRRDLADDDVGAGGLWPGGLAGSVRTSAARGPACRRTVQPIGDALRDSWRLPPSS